MSQPDPESKITWSERFEYVSMMVVLAPLLVVPHRVRVPLAGVMVARLVAPVLGWNKRITDHLALAMPELSDAERAQLARDVPNQLGRLFIELFSASDMGPIAAQAPFTGAGVAHLDKALADGSPVICVSGHFGNYDVFRSALIQRGFDVGALYRPLNNRLINARYERAVFAVGGRMFARGRRGLADMVRHLRKGNLLALLVDQHMARGAKLTFFGQRASTAVSAAQMALKYGAILVPIYAVRRPDGLSFDIHVEAPVAHSDEVTMTQHLNDSLEARVRANPEQWLWTHRRWKAKKAKPATKP